MRPRLSVPYCGSIPVKLDQPATADTGELFTFSTLLRVDTSETQRRRRAALGIVPFSTLLRVDTSETLVRAPRGCDSVSFQYPTAGRYQ